MFNVILKFVHYLCKRPDLGILGGIVFLINFIYF